LEGIEYARENLMDRILTEDIVKKLLSLEKDHSPKPSQSGDVRRSGTCDHWTRAVLLERAVYLRELARLGEGTAVEIIREYPDYNTILSVRLRSGSVEMHEKVARLFIVLDGHATLVTGGAIERKEQIACGEIRGSAITGGSNQELRAGDIVHVGAGVPDQIILEGDETLTCLIIKITKSVEP
jgi:mannose-6-phosphate isomerase-like protein (cupin superfamily)